MTISFACAQLRHAGPTVRSKQENANASIAPAARPNNTGNLQKQSRQHTMVCHCARAHETGSLVCWHMKAVFTLALCVCSFAVSAAENVRLSSLDLTRMRQGWGKPQIDRSIREQPLSIGGRRFDHGVGTHAKSVLWVDLGGGAERFKAFVGVDDAAGSPKASVAFKIVADGRTLWRSGPVKLGQPPIPVDVDLRGVRTLILLVGDTGDGIEFDHADWADAVFVVNGPAPKTIDPPREEPIILTPPPAPRPRINGPRVFGVRPGSPFLFKIPATGERPIHFAVAGLPKGLKLDPHTGIITGSISKPGTYVVTLRATNLHGTASRKFRIVCGDKLALTPPMGLNHWYTHYDRITDKLVREAADAMVNSGMADVGYQYVSIDDCWMNAPKHKDPMRVGPLRDSQGNILPNRHFPDMKALTDYIHAKGLKAGIYTSPGPFTCAGFAGAYQHEAQDARQFAQWGFDLLKYDWCSYGEIAKNDPDPEPVKLKKPYILMATLLKQQPRDIILNLCQYGMGNVWEWGAEVGGHSWRTAGDLGFELDRIFEVALKNAEHRQWSKPGSWNDPDYIQIGKIGDARGMGEPTNCPLTPNEQYAFMSLWCLMAAPLFYSGDMGALDPFTLNVLCNPEVIEIDQDPLGQCARVIHKDEDTFVMVKDMEDGCHAVGLFNRGEAPATVSVRWTDLGLKPNLYVRDVWRQKDLGKFKSSFTAEVPRHAGVLLRVGQKKYKPQ
jgi:alpha-galactosidase